MAEPIESTSSEQIKDGQTPELATPQMTATPEAATVAPNADIPTLDPTLPVSPLSMEPDPEAEIRKLSRRSFLWAGVISISGIAGIIAFNKYAPVDSTGLKSAFRTTHEFNENVARGLFFSDNHRAKEVPREWAVEPRNNYKGTTPEIDLDTWKLHVMNTAGGDKTITLADLKKLPHMEQTTELKCVEGWSAFVNWGGVRFEDFAKAFPPPLDAKYVAMRSEPEGFEDEWYYVGLDLASCLHPQTLLATERAGKPLDTAHGAPLRLVMPHKYGIKNIKLITHIAYVAERPKDYWADLGYDWYAGL